MCFSQVLLMGQENVQASWCKEKDLPCSLIEEYDHQVQPCTELHSVNFSGQAAVTAVVVAGVDCLKEPQAKRSRTDHFNSTTEGYKVYNPLMCR